ncbi:Na/Pi cotransporter family protein [Azospirillum sp.]|uniref:Na/Pi cotransporter family protein n=1 Tax=Azospirillum sp. TaxID=34012 RepID=UPI002D698F70|nr:Na/Pi cotransporter family protein [Azospirillum sp.]HYD64644.1 Na/Pi cotransporter family protein [Azospirillum sp.]
MVLVDILGAVALLLWGLRLVRTGVFRAFGPSLRRWVALATRDRVRAFAGGFAATLALQSSAATALMAASMAGQRLLPTAMALAVMLGADVGTSVVAVLLALDLRWLSPVLILAGGALFALGDASGRRRAVARTLVGLGLVLLALRLLADATVPVRESELIHAVLSALGSAPVLALLAAAGLTVATYSSLAVVLLIASLAAAGFLDLAPAAAMVLGANLGGALPPLIATLKDGALARRVPFGNLLMRGAGAAVALPFTALLPAAPADAHAVMMLHVAFNLGLAALLLPLVGPVARLTAARFPHTDDPDDATRPRHLDESALEAPSVAIACAARETLRLGDVVEEMLRRSLDVLRHDDERAISEVSRMDDVVDALHTAIKLYLVKLGREQLDEADGKRVGAMMAFAINLEHVGDIIEKNLMELAAKKIRHRRHFAAEDFRAIEELHARTLGNLRTALGVFLSEDRRLARALIAEKDAIRALERTSADRHLDRVRQGRAECIETSALFLDVLRDLKRINAHVASVAYPILDQSGELRGSRLRTSAPSPAAEQGRGLGITPSS